VTLDVRNAKDPPLIAQRVSQDTYRFNPRVQTHLPVLAFAQPHTIKIKHPACIATPLALLAKERDLKIAPVAIPRRTTSILRSLHARLLVLMDSTIMNLPRSAILA
jgi:hypothetical protein